MKKYGLNEPVKELAKANIHLLRAKESIDKNGDD
jgi:hypothetical protein